MKRERRVTISQLYTARRPVEQFPTTVRCLKYSTMLTIIKVSCRKVRLNPVGFLYTDLSGWRWGWGGGLRSVLKTHLARLAYQPVIRLLQERDTCRWLYFKVVPPVLPRNFQIHARRELERVSDISAPLPNSQSQHCKHISTAVATIMCKKKVPWWEWYLGAHCTEIQYIVI